MSLQMPPDGGGYSRSLHSGILIPRDLIARDASGEIVPLPERVGRDVLDMTPATIAIENVVLPVRVRADSEAIEFLQASDLRDDVVSREKLRFIINHAATFLYAERSAVERLIDFAYLDGEIGNCDRSFSTQCPRTFQRLAATEDARCRICPECGRAVRIEATEASRRLRESAGLLNAVPVESEVTEVLQEFSSYSTGDDPSSAAAAWPAWTPSRRQRYEILELPEPFRQERELLTEVEEEPPAAE